MSGYGVDIEAVRAARERIAEDVHRTPVLTSETLDRVSGRSLYFKCENFQKVGAFKFRGASNFVKKLPEETASLGVVTHSSGNHAQALSLAARLRGIPAHIVMPVNASPVKIRAVEGYGGRVIRCASTLQAREETASEVLAETGGTFIHPYDHPDINAGQGTVALELSDQVPEPDAIVAPVGGGGLDSGIGVGVRGEGPSFPVFASEPSGADDAARSKCAGRLIPQKDPRTIADGLLTSLGEFTWPILRDHVEQVITVTDEEIVQSMRLILERMKIVVEPSAAVPLAAVLKDEFRSIQGLDRIGIILSGGNVDFDRLPWQGDCL